MNDKRQNNQLAQSGSVVRNQQMVLAFWDDREKPRGSTPPTPPDMRVRIRRFGGLSNQRTVNLGIPSDSK